MQRAPLLVEQAMNQTEFAELLLHVALGKPVFGHAPPTLDTRAAAIKAIAHLAFDGDSSPESTFMSLPDDIVRGLKQAFSRRREGDVAAAESLATKLTRQRRRILGLVDETGVKPTLLEQEAALDEMSQEHWEALKQALAFERSRPKH